MIWLLGLSCFLAIVFIFVCVLTTLPLNVMVVCDCDISWPRLLMFMTAYCVLNNLEKQILQKQRRPTISENSKLVLTVGFL